MYNFLVFYNLYVVVYVLRALVVILARLVILMIFHGVFHAHDIVQRLLHLQVLQSHRLLLQMLTFAYLHVRIGHLPADHIFLVLRLLDDRDQVVLHLDLDHVLLLAHLVDLLLVLRLHGLGFGLVLGHLGVVVLGVLDVHGGRGDCEGLGGRDADGDLGVLL